MKLYQYLTEAKAQEIEYDDPEKEYYKIVKDCRKYFGLLGKKRPLYRAVNQKFFASNVYLKKKVRLDRKPRSHKTAAIWIYLNNALLEMGHVPRIASVSATVQRAHATIFTGMVGKVYYFFPIGDFSYSWAPTVDFNYDTKEWPIEDTKIDVMAAIGIRNDEEAGMKILKKLFKKVTTNKEFDTAYSRNYEIWFRCKEYYLVEPGSELGRLF